MICITASSVSGTRSAALVFVLDPREDDDLDSTLIRQGTNAATFTDMTEFVQIIQQRPLDKLLEDLPGLATLSETKFSLARQTIRRRVRTLPRVEYEQLRGLAFEVAQATGGEIGERIRSLFTFA